MEQMVPFFEIHQAVDEAVSLLIQRLQNHGLLVLRTFDLQAARKAHGDCPCPHHGTDRCDCQIVVLLVYDGVRNPATLVVHGADGKVWFSLVDSPEQRAEIHLEEVILQAINPQNLLMPRDMALAPARKFIYTYTSLGRGTSGVKHKHHS